MNTHRNDVDSSTAFIANYIRAKGINLQRMAETVGIPYYLLYSSLGKSNSRSLKADELIKICDFLDLDLLDIRNMVLSSLAENTDPRSLIKKEVG